MTFDNLNIAADQTGSTKNVNYTTSGTILVQQTGSFEINSYVANLTISNTKTIFLAATLNYDLVREPTWCVNTISNVAVATTDTLQEVKITQNVVASHGLICGTPSYGFSSDSKTEAHDANEIVLSSTGV